jgi:hypothetical protein
MRRHARSIAGAAVIAGVSADTLLRGGTIRLGLALWVVTLVCAVLVIDLENATSGGRRQRHLLLAGMVCAVFGLVWRDSPLLYAIDCLSLLCVGALLVWHGTGASLAQLTVVESLRAAGLAAVNTLGGAAGVVRDTTDAIGKTPALASRGRAVALGGVLSVPPLVIVGSLLSSSDDVFGKLMSMAADRVGTLGSEHLFVSLVFAWLTAGWLRAAVGDQVLETIPRVHAPRVSFATVGVPVYLLGALLALFLATQMGMMFGGAAFLLRTAGLTAANYAREGFFQLIAASLVVLATLVATEWMLAPDDDRGRRHFRGAAILLLSLVTVLVGSAVTRLTIYVGVFGMSVDRFFAYAMIAWVLFALATFAATTARGRADRFAPTALVVTVGWVAMLNIVNPEAIVVHANAARAAAGKPFDATYHAALSADALPALQAIAPRLDAANCKALADSLRSAWGVHLAASRSSGADWRSTDLPLAWVRTWYTAGAVLPCSAS